MGKEGGDQNRLWNHKTAITLLVLSTYLVSLYVLIGLSNDLVATRSIVSKLQLSLNSTNMLVQALLIDLTRDYKISGNEINKFDNEIDFGIDQVIETKPKGSILVGLELGVGTGSFVGRMRERNVSIVVQSDVLDDAQFLPNEWDIVHSMGVLSDLIPDDMLEFVLCNVFKALKPGGLLWIERFDCIGTQLDGTYFPMMGRVGFKKIRSYAEHDKNRLKFFENLIRSASKPSNEGIKRIDFRYGWNDLDM